MTQLESILSRAPKQIGDLPGTQPRIPFRARTKHISINTTLHLWKAYQIPHVCQERCGSHFKSFMQSSSRVTVKGKRILAVNARLSCPSTTHDPMLSSSWAKRTKMAGRFISTLLSGTIIRAASPSAPEAMMQNCLFDRMSHRQMEPMQIFAFALHGTQCKRSSLWNIGQLCWRSQAVPGRRVEGLHLRVAATENPCRSDLQCPISCSHAHAATSRGLDTNMRTCMSNLSF